MNDSAYYRKLGFDLGFTGAQLSEVDKTGKSWQARAMRAGFRAGRAAIPPATRACAYPFCVNHKLGAIEYCCNGCRWDHDDYKEHNDAQG